MSQGHSVGPARRGSTRELWAWSGVVAAVLLALPAVAPLAAPGVPDTYDLPFHAARMVELRDAITTGNLFPRWVQPFVGGLGFPFFNFYPPLAYYLATSLTVTGLSVIVAYKLAAALSVLLASVAMCAWMVEVLKEAGASKKQQWCSALGASAAYVYAPYFLTDIYRRGALPESLGLALLPVMFLSFEKLLRRPRLESVPPAAVSVAALVLAHNVASVLGVALVALYTGSSAVATKLVPRADGFHISARQIAGYSALAAGLGLGASAFVWLPLLMERSYLATTFQFLQSGLFDTEARLADSWPPLQFSLVYDYGKMYDDWGQLYRAGLVQVLAALIGLGLLVHLRRHRVGVWPGEAGLAGRVLFFALATLALMSSLSPLFGVVWRAPILTSFQFPWRVQGTVALATAFLTGAGLYWLSDRWPRAFPGIQVVVVVGLALASLLRLPGDMVAEPPLALGDIHRYTSLAGWSPPEELPLPQLSVEEASGLSRLLDMEEGPGFVTLVLEASRASTVVLHTLHFPGWKVYVDGREVPAFAVSPRGLLGFEVSEGAHSVLARFEDTPLRQTAQAVAVLSVFGLLIVASVPFARRKVSLVATGGVVALTVICFGVPLPDTPLDRVEYHSLDLSAQNGVRLLGAGIDGTGEGVLGVTLYWQTLRPLEELESFVALLDERGRAVGNPMRKPLDGAYSTSEWQIGEIVADRVEVEHTGEIDLSSLSVVAGLRPFHPTGSSSPVVSFRAPLTAGKTTERERQAKVVMDGVLALESFDLSAAVIAPGDDLTVGLDWHALGTVGGDVGTYLHLVAGGGQLVAQSDGPPGPPGFPAVLWQAGESVSETRTLRVSEDAPPGRYSLRLGGYRYPDLEPVPITLEGQRASGANIGIADVFVVADETRPGVVRASKLLSATFGGKVELLGFDLSSDTLRPGESLTLTTYWRSRERLPTDYLLFAQLLDGSGVIRGQKDSQPADGSYPTSIWEPGEYVMDTRVVAVDGGAPPGDYRLVLGMYQWPDLRRLSVDVDGVAAGDVLNLGVVHVLPMNAEAAR